jgi:hypothetical protein
MLCKYRYISRLFYFVELVNPLFSEFIFLLKKSNTFVAILNGDLFANAFSSN